MKKFASKSVLLFAMMTAMCAVAPSMVSAASWSPLTNPHHTIDSANAGFVIDSNGTASVCRESTLTATVTSASDLRITSASYRRCTASGPAIGSCTMTVAATGLPWRATPTSTSTVTFDGVHIDALLENHPGDAACTATGVTIRFTGSINNGGWNNASRHVTLPGTTGLVSHSPLGNGVPATANGTLRDTQQTLQILP
jgi:hypothetical protein